MDLSDDCFISVYGFGGGVPGRLRSFGEQLWVANTLYNGHFIIMNSSRGTCTFSQSPLMASDQRHELFR